MTHRVGEPQSIRGEPGITTTRVTAFANQKEGVGDHRLFT
jgi:hypothetical protein